MATKRKRTKEPNSIADGSARGGKPERRPAPRKRTEASRDTDAPRAAEAPRGAGESRSAGASRDVDVQRNADPASTRVPRGGRRPAKPRKRRLPLVAVCTVLVLALAVTAVFSWDRWLRYDDAREFQGEWRSHGTTAVVVIDGQSIKLTEDVAFSYTLDTGAKTIAFKFGASEGQGRYRFSLDRTQLVITDGEGYSGVSTLLEDIPWMVDQLVRSIKGESQEETASGENVAVLDRLSHDSSASPRVEKPAAGESGTDGADGAGSSGTASDAGDAGSSQDGADQDGSPNSADASDDGAKDASKQDGEAGTSSGGGQDSDSSSNAGSSQDAAGSGASKSPRNLFDVSDVGA